MRKHGVFLKWGKATMFCPSALTSHSLTIPACIKPQTIVSVKLIQSFSNSCKDKRISSFQRQSSCIQNSQMCASMHISSIHWGRDINAEIYLPLSSHHAAVIVSNIYSNYSFHHFWFTKKKKKKVNTSLEFLHSFFSPFGEKKPWMSHCGYNVALQNFQRLKFKCFLEGFFEGFTRFPVDILMGRRWCLQL